MGAGARLPVGHEDMRLAAYLGQLEVLKWAREQGCPWDSWTCYHAAAGGHLEVEQWARGRDCPRDQSTCHTAARRGHLEVLMWAREHGCPWVQRECAEDSWRHPETHGWVRAQP